MTLNAITEDATGRVVEWGDNALRAPGAGETANANVSDASQSVIDEFGPDHTKIVADAFTEMTSGEKDVVDAIDLVLSNAEGIAELVAVLDGNLVDQHLAVSGAVVLDFSRFDSEIELAASLASGNITFANLPPAGIARRITVKISQSGAGAFLIPANAWPAIVDWGTKAAPVFGEAATNWRYVHLYYDGTVVAGFYDENVSG